MKLSLRNFLRETLKFKRLEIFKIFKRVYNLCEATHANFFIQNTSTDDINFIFQDLYFKSQ